MHETEALANDPGVSEKFLDLRGEGVGDEIEILGIPALHEIAHGTAHDVGLMAGTLEPFDDPRRIRIDHGPFYAMLALGVDEGLFDRFAFLVSTVSDEHEEASLVQHDA